MQHHLPEASTTKMTSLPAFLASFFTRRSSFSTNTLQNNKQHQKRIAPKKSTRLARLCFEIGRCKSTVPRVGRFHVLMADPVQIVSGGGRERSCCA